MQDPQSLHKYLYVHGDPIQGMDPTGMVLAGAFAGSMIGANLNSIQGNSALKVLEMVSAVAAGASAGQALAAAVVLDTILLGLPFAGGAIQTFSHQFRQNISKFARKLPIVTRGGSHRLVMPGIGRLLKLDDLLDQAFDTSRALNAGNRRVLREQLEAANDLPKGTLVGQGVQAHHVVPREFSPAGNRTHSLLDELDFNIDAALNGIPLHNTYHFSNHPFYNDAWHEVLNRIQAAPYGKTQKQDLLVGAIAKANTAILQGPGLRKTSSTNHNFIPKDKWVQDILPDSLR